MCRPKKNILLFCDNEIQLSVHKFIFESKTWPRIWPAPSLAVAEALTSGKHGTFDAAVILIWKGTTEPAILARTLKARDIPFVVVFKKVAYSPALIDSPHQGVFDTTAKMQDVVDRVRTLCARKRGPKKKTAEGVSLTTPIYLAEASA